ncbi:hypothetical protein [Bacillus sp. FJAT-22090]|uniref:hypothetical protein n=1 Tax=Bacillus sp. FJAT-22090 TaxID=1581038 RepID=UPI0011AA4D48|nr:hypothetical protein [Bacillus sp. FJAT-22090]
MKHKIGDKAVTKTGYHNFEIGSELMFQGMDYDAYDLETYVFKDSTGRIEYLVASEFEWK